MCLQSKGRKLQNYDNATHFLFNKRLENKLGFLSPKLRRKLNYIYFFFQMKKLARDGLIEGLFSIKTHRDRTMSLDCIHRLKVPFSLFDSSCHFESLLGTDSKVKSTLYSILNSTRRKYCSVVFI